MASKASLISGSIDLWLVSSACTQRPSSHGCGRSYLQPPLIYPFRHQGRSARWVGTSADFSAAAVAGPAGRAGGHRLRGKPSSWTAGQGQGAGGLTGLVASHAAAVPVPSGRVRAVSAKGDRCEAESKAAAAADMRLAVRGGVPPDGGATARPRPPLPTPPPGGGERHSVPVMAQS
jgi:hypothetical protein